MIPVWLRFTHCITLLCFEESPIGFFLYLERMCYNAIMFMRTIVTCFLNDAKPGDQVKIGKNILIRKVNQRVLVVITPFVIQVWRFAGQ